MQTDNAEDDHQDIETGLPQVESYKIVNKERSNSQRRHKIEIWTTGKRSSGVITKKSKNTTKFFCICLSAAKL